MTLLATLDTSTLMLAIAALACLALFYFGLRIRRAARQRVWQRQLAEETRLRKM